MKFVLTTLDGQRVGFTMLSDRDCMVRSRTDQNLSRRFGLLQMAHKLRSRLRRRLS